MKRLRHPVRAIREPFGTAGLIVACLALVFAMAGGALAAKGGLTGKQRKEVAKIAKHYAGKRGPRGKNGQNGQNGTNGAPGAKGDKGANGATGPAGQTGAPGAPGANGKNGVNGTNGEDGACSNAKPVCTLPPGGTETGVWIATSARFIEMSFNMAMAAAPVEVNYVKENGKELFGAGHSEERSPVNCLGTPEEPKAAAGHVCMYALVETPDFKFNFEETPPAILFKTGAMVNVSGTAGWGSWAATAATS